MIDHLAAAVTGGHAAAVVLRSFTEEVSHTLANGTPIPVKHVCGWILHDGVFQPLDADTGGPMAPESSVEVVDAWPVDLADFHTVRPGSC